MTGEEDGEETPAGKDGRVNGNESSEGLLVLREFPDFGERPR